MQSMCLPTRWVKFCSQERCRSRPTGSSVVSISSIWRRCARKPPPALMSLTSARAAKSIEHNYEWLDGPSRCPGWSGAISEVASVLAEYGLSIDQIQQRDSAGGMATVALILDPVQEDQFRMRFKLRRSIERRVLAQSGCRPANSRLSRA